VRERKADIERVDPTATLPNRTPNAANTVRSRLAQGAAGDSAGLAFGHRADFAAAVVDVQHSKVVRWR
jgi:hypothetical protein